jgi:hypothetical protein
MAPNDDRPYLATTMVEAVQEMGRKLETFERHSDDERRKLRAGIDATVAAMRKDFWETTIKIQRDAAQHRDEHSAERSERATDGITRSNRQLVLDIWMGALTIVSVINLLIGMYLIFHGVR